MSMPPSLGLKTIEGRVSPKEAEEERKRAEEEEKKLGEEILAKVKAKVASQMFAASRSPSPKTKTKKKAKKTKKQKEIEEEAETLCKIDDAIVDITPKKKRKVEKTLKQNFYLNNISLNNLIYKQRFDTLSAKLESLVESVDSLKKSKSVRPSTAHKCACSGKLTSLTKILSNLQKSANDILSTVEKIRGKDTVNLNKTLNNIQSVCNNIHSYSMHNYESLKEVSKNFPTF